MPRITSSFDLRGTRFVVTTDHSRRRGAATYRRGQAFRRRARRNVVRARTTLKTATTTEFAHTRGRLHGGRAPTRGAPTGPNDMATSVGLCTREGTHKGGGRPQGAPLRARTIWQRALVCAHERAPTRGEGAHKGRPYGPERYATSVGLCTREGTHKGGGRPQGAPLRARTIWQRVKLAAISW